MKAVVTILLFFIYSNVFAQANAENLKQAVKSFDKALLQRDTVTLNGLLYNDLAYGHSTGWIQTKQEIKEDLYNGKLVYETIKSDITDIDIVERTACVRMDSELEVKYKSKDVKMKLHVLQVWIEKDNRWVLMGRQSVKKD